MREKQGNAVLPPTYIHMNIKFLFFSFHFFLTSIKYLHHWIGFFSTHCIKDFDLGGSEVSGGNCEERRELKPNDEKIEGEHETVIISQHEVLSHVYFLFFKTFLRPSPQVSHHGHSHAHSHLHSAPRNISSVAWMVICGDGIHNLADGFVFLYI